MNSPGRRSVVPYTISAAVELMPCLGDVLMPRRMSGRVSMQASGLGWAMADLRCPRSTHVKRYVKPWVGGRDPTLSI